MSKDPDCQHIRNSVVELSRRRENDWKIQVAKRLKDNFKEFTGKRQAKVDKFEPSQRLDNALTELQCISDEDMNNPDFIGNSVSINQARELSKIIERIKRNMGL